MSALYVVLIGLAFALIECLVCGTRLLFSLPAYLILAVAGIASVADFRRPKVNPDRFCLVATAVFAGYILCRGLTSPVAYIAWADQFLVLGCLLIYLLTACYLTDPRRRLWVLGCLLVLAAVNLGVGVRQFVQGDGFMLFGFLRSTQYLGRASGLYICPDHLAFFLAVAGGVALSVAIWGRLGGVGRVAYAAAGLSCYAGLLITGSRGGFLSCAVGSVVLAMSSLWRLYRTSPRLLGRGVMIVLFVALAVGGTLAVVIPRSNVLQSRARQLVTTQDVRLRLWRAGWQQFKTSPTWGTGAATYLYYGRRFRDSSVQNDPIRTHNDYLELLGEYGLVGAAGCLLFLLAHLWAGWKGLRAFSRHNESLQSGAGGSNAAAWNLGALAALAVAGAHSVVDFNLHIPANALLMAFLLGVLANPGRPWTSNMEPTEHPGWLVNGARLALPVLALSVFVVGVPRLPGEYYSEKARVAVRDGRMLVATTYALKGLEREKRNPYLYMYLGEARLSLAGDRPETPATHSFRLAADEAFQAGLKLAYCETALLLRRVQLLTIFGDFSTAGRTMDEAIKWDGQSALMFTYYGFYLQHAGRPAEARGAYERALQLAPNVAAREQFDRLGQIAP